ncbi:P44/Msp2 family outer membrane protein, partial [Ehrlichia minasensis]
MNCKKIFVATALMSLMYSLPNLSFSDTIQDGKISGDFYISGKYMPSVSQFGVFSATEEKVSTAQLYGLKNDWLGRQHPTHNDNDFNNKGYSFKYENNPFLGFAGAIGYSMYGPRIELEVLYEVFEVKNQNNCRNDAHKYCALCQSGASHDTSPATGRYVLLKNEGLTDISFMINACYDIVTDGIPFSPYVCVGVGTDLVSMFDTINPKISYQGKLGLSYPINPEASVFI